MTLSELSFEEVHSIAKNIEGWLSDKEARFLYECAASLSNRGALVEIGSWCGKSMIYVTSAALKNGFNNKIFSIDPFLTSKDVPNGKFDMFVFNLNKNGILDRVTQIREKSQIVGESFNENIEFIFIDGFHKYDAVKRDFELFFPKVVNQGFIAIHDICCYEGPTRLVIELVENNSIKIVDFCDSIILIQKVEVISESDIQNNLRVVEEMKARTSDIELIK